MAETWVEMERLTYQISSTSFSIRVFLGCWGGHWQLRIYADWWARP